MNRDKITINEANNSNIIAGDMNGNITTTNQKSNTEDQAKDTSPIEDTKNMKIIEKLIDNKFSFIAILTLVLSILIVYKI